MRGAGFRCVVWGDSVRGMGFRCIVWGDSVRGVGHRNCGFIQSL